MVALLLLLAELLLDAAVGVGAVGWFVAATVDECPSTGIVIVVAVIVASVPANEPSATAVAVRNARSKIDGTGSSIDGSATVTNFVSRNGERGLGLGLTHASGGTEAAGRRGAERFTKLIRELYALAQRGRIGSWG